MISIIDNALYPELTRFPTRHARDEALVRARKDAPHRNRISKKTLALAFGLLLFLSLTDLIMPNPPQGPRVTASIICGVIFIAVIVAGIRHARQQVRACIREELCRAGVLTCIRCGYHLSDLPSQICPECGVPLERSLVAIAQSAAPEARTR